LGKSLPNKLVGTIGSLVIAVCFAISIQFYSLVSQTDKGFEIELAKWFQLGDLSIGFNFLIDRLSVLMLLIITGVGFCIHLYSIGYMSGDNRFHRFFAYLNLFIFFMQMLVIGGNYLITFIGWEGVGLCSYLLIGFWYEKTAYNNAARKAFIMNRIGDLGLIIGLFLIINQFGSLNYTTVNALAEKNFLANGVFNDPTIIFISLMLFVGATGKSAQIPLYTWLPDAMAGPTPVSALIHAATMVTAGIFLIVRSSVLFHLAPITLDVVTYIGIATSIFAATIGLAQNDIKKVLAYSTVSQLGLMFMALGIGAYGTAMFHLTTHAFFKALLFLGAGSVIHGMGNEQDIRKMGGLRKKMPITFITFLIATIAITGIPPFAGFFSKDEILAKAFANSPTLWILGVLSASLTAVYMFRLLFLTFFGTFRGCDAIANHKESQHDTAHDADVSHDSHDNNHGHQPVTRLEQVHESPGIMTIPLIVLAILSMVGGFMGIPELFGAPHRLQEWLKPILGYLPTSEHHIAESTEYILMGVSVGLVLIVAIICYRIFTRKSANDMANENQASVFKLLANKYYVDEIYNTVFVLPTMYLSKFWYQVVDTLVIDGFVNGIGRAVNWTGDRVRRVQTGQTGTYIFAMVVAIAIILIYSLIPALTGKM